MPEGGGDPAASAFVATNTSGAAAGLTWMFLGWLYRRPSALGAATGAVVGLAAVTPAAGFIDPIAGIPIGIVAAVNSAGADGLLLGNSTLFVKQLIGVLVVGGYAFGATWVLGKVVDVVVGLRVKGDEETVGLDISQHGERAFGGILS